MCAALFRKITLSVALVALASASAHAQARTPRQLGGSTTTVSVPLPRGAFDAALSPRITLSPGVTLPPGLSLPPGVTVGRDGQLTLSLAGGGGGGGGSRDVNDFLEGLEGSSPSTFLGRTYTISDRIANSFFERDITLEQQGGTEDPLWDVWVDGTYQNVDDDREGRDGDADLGEVIVGFHHRFGESLIAGLAGGYEGGNVDTFGSFVESDYDGFFIGPFVGFRATENVLIDLWLGYARDDVDTEIDGLSGDYDVDRFFLSANVTGEWDLGAVRVRPRGTISYIYDDADSFSYSGGGARLPVDSRDDDFGTLEAMLEMNRVFQPSQSYSLVPFARIAAKYAYQQVNDGRILGDDLREHSTDRWWGEARGGIRLLTSGRTAIEASGGYDSIGTSDLDSWDVRVSAQFFF